MTIRLTPNRIWQLSYGLSERDVAIVRSLSKVRVASVRQLERLHFLGQPRTARRVLAELTQRRVVARLGRTVGGVRAGSAGQVYALDVVGQSLSESGGPAHGARLRRPWTPGARFIDHVLAVTEVYVLLVEAERDGSFELIEFSGEPDCWRQFSPMGVPLILKPDAFVRLGFIGFEDSYFIEVDRGTESLRTLQVKGEMYRQYWSSGEEQLERGVFPKVLWLVNDRERSRPLKAAVASAGTEGPGLHEVILSSGLREHLATSVDEVSHA